MRRTCCSPCRSRWRSPQGRRRGIHQSEALRWTPEEIAAVSGVLKNLTTLDAPLQASGLYIREPQLAKAWEGAAAGINRILDVYGLGKPPRYSPSRPRSCYQAQPSIAMKTLRWPVATWGRPFFIRLEPAVWDQRIGGGIRWRLSTRIAGCTAFKAYASLTRRSCLGLPRATPMHRPCCWQNWARAPSSPKPRPIAHEGVV